MSYIGRGVDAINNVEKLDLISFSGSTATFNLTKNSVAFTPVSAEAIRLSIDGVEQGLNYSVSGSTITFDFTPASTSTMNWIYHIGVGVLNTPADGSVSLAKMASNSVDSDQYVDGSIDAVHLSANSVDSDAYVDGSIDAVHLSANSVDSDAYVDASIDNAHLADDAVGVAELSATGTASSSTFLRGDNTWATPTDTSGSLVYVGGSESFSGNSTASFEFDDVFSSTYHYYRINCSFAMNSAGDDLWMQWRYDGSNYSSGNYRYTQDWTSMTSSSVVSAYTGYSGTNETKIVMGNNLSGALGELSSFTIDVYHPMTTSQKLSCMITGFIYQNNGTTDMTTSNCRLDDEAGNIDGFRFLTNNSTISYRGVRIWAYKNS